MDNSNNWIKFEKLLNLEKYILQIFGLRSMKTLFLNKPHYVKNIYETIYILFSFTVVGYLTFMNILYTISVWQDDVDSAITMLSIVFTVMVTITKGIIIWFYQEELYNILNNLHEKWNKSWTRIEIRDQILETVVRVTKFRNIYVVALIGLFITYTYPPIGNVIIYLYKNTNESMDYSQTMWEAEVYPIEIDTFLKYFYLSTMDIYQSVVYIICCYVGDIFYVQIFTHISIQFRVLANDITTTVNTNKNGDSKKLSMELKHIVMRHQELYKLFDIMNDGLYSSVIFTSFVIGSINMCLNIFEFQKAVDEGDYYAASRFLFLTVTIFSGIILYCVQAEIICASAEFIPEAIYNSQWSNIDKNSILTLQIIMTRCQRKLTCGAYGLVDIHHEQITQVCRRTASFFVFLDSIQ